MYLYLCIYICEFVFVYLNFGRRHTILIECFLFSSINCIFLFNMQSCFEASLAVILIEISPESRPSSRALGHLLLLRPKRSPPGEAFPPRLQSRSTKCASLQFPICFLPLLPNFQHNLSPRRPTMSESGHL